MAVDLSECLVVMERAVQCLQCPCAIEVEGGRGDVYEVGGKETREGGGSGGERDDQVRRGKGGIKHVTSAVMNSLEDMTFSSFGFACKTVSADRAQCTWPVGCVRGEMTERK